MVGMEHYLLKTEEPSEVARLSSLHPLNTEWRFYSYSYQFDLSGFALINVNLSDGALYRVVVPDVTAPVGVSRTEVAPNAESGGFNKSGTVADVDEPLTALDSNSMNPAVIDQQWGTTFSWGVMPFTPSTGQNMAYFVLAVRLIGSPFDFYPSAQVELKESGVLKRDLGYKAVSELSGQVLIFPFDPSELADPGLSNVEITVTFQPGDNLSYCRLEALALGIENPASGLRYDSGWRSVPFSFFSTNKDSPQPVKNIDHWLDEPVTGVTILQVLFMDDQTELNPELSSAPPPGFHPGVSVASLHQIPEGYIQAGHAVAGESIDPEPGLEGRSPYRSGVKVVQSEGNTIGGQSYGSDVIKSRTLEEINISCSRNVALTLMDRIGWRRGESGPFYVAVEPDIDAKFRLFTSFFCTARGIDMHPHQGSRPETDPGEVLFVLSVSELSEKL